MRPISLQSILRKIKEKFVKSQIVNYFEENQLFFDYQFGFRTNGSIHATIFLLTDDVLRARNKHFYTCTGYLDLSKAFNCVDHAILNNKLYHYAIRDKYLNWFKTYLTDRLQFTTIGKHVSGKVKITNGGPQGSVRGHIPYLIYVKDIEFCKINSCILKIIVLISNHVDPVMASAMLEDDLKVISKYFASLKSILNAKKTKIMNFCKNWRSGDQAKFPKLYLDEHEIESVSTFKYLGGTIDLNLNFRKHLELCIRNAFSKIYVLNKIRNLMSSHTTLTLFKAMVYPNLRVW